MFLTARASWSGSFVPSAWRRSIAISASGSVCPCGLVVRRTMIGSRKLVLYLDPIEVNPERRGQTRVEDALFHERHQRPGHEAGEFALRRPLVSLRLLALRDVIDVDDHRTGRFSLVLGDCAPFLTPTSLSVYFRNFVPVMRSAKTGGKTPRRISLSETGCVLIRSRS